MQTCCALTGEGLKEGLDWLSERLSARVKMGGNRSAAAHMGVTKMPENSHRANLSDLTIRTSQFFSEKGNPDGSTLNDIEAGGS